jgi:predicted anti-sigma-YlaC factor YlaD
MKMQCAEIKDLILAYPELASEERSHVDAHAPQCEECREYLEAARELDLALTRVALHGTNAPQRLELAVIARIAPGPSYLPEIFDFVGWAAMITVAVGLASEFLATYAF